MWDRSATGQPPAIHPGRAPRRAVPASWPLQMHNLRPITAEERTAALLAAWDDPRLIGDSGTQVASQPPLVFQEVVAWRRPLDSFQHRPAACLVWASPDSPDAAVSIPRSAASGPLTHLAGSAEALPDGERYSVGFWKSLMRSVFGWRRFRSGSGGATEPRHEDAQSWPSAPREDDAPEPAAARAAEAGETGPATARNDRRAVGVASPAHLVGRPPQSLVLGRPLATSGACPLPPAPDVPISRSAKATSAADRHRSSVRPGDAGSTSESAVVHKEHPSGDSFEAPSNGPVAGAAKGGPAMSHVSSDQGPPTIAGRPRVGSAAAHRSGPRLPRRIEQAPTPHPATWHPSSEAVSPAPDARAAHRPSLLVAAPHRPGSRPGATPSAPSRDEASKPSPNTAYEAPSAPPALRRGPCDVSQSVTGAAAAAVFRTSPETGSGRGRLKVGQQVAERRQVVEPPAAPPQQTALKPPFRVSTPLGARASGVAPREATGPVRNRGPRSVTGISPGAIAGSRVGQTQAVQAAQQEMAQLFTTRGSDRARTGHTLADMVLSARRLLFLPRASAGSLAGPPPGSSTASPDRTGLVQRPRPSGATPPPPTGQGPALALAPGACRGPQSLPTSPESNMPGAAATVLGTGAAPGLAADSSRAGPLATTPSASAPGRGRSRVMPYARTAATPEDPRTAWIPTERRPAVSVTAARPVRAHFVPAIASSGGGLVLSPAQRQPGNPSVPLRARMKAGSVTVPADLRTGGSANWGVPGGRSAQERR